MLTYEERHERLPGMYLPWELPDILQIGGEYRLEIGAETTDGSLLLTVFRRVSNTQREACT